MQGSKISKPEGCGEDGEGGCSGRVGWWWGLAFVPTPPPGSPEKITEQAHSSRLRALPSDWIRRASRCWSCSRGLGTSPSPHSHTPRDDLTAPAALTHTTCWSRGPTGPQLTLARSGDSQRPTHTRQRRLTSQMKINGFPLNNVCY